MRTAMDVIPTPQSVSTTCASNSTTSPPSHPQPQSPPPRPAFTPFLPHLPPWAAIATKTVQDAIHGKQSANTTSAFQRNPSSQPALSQSTHLLPPPQLTPEQSPSLS